jgi:hypothetical protein
VTLLQFVEQDRRSAIDRFLQQRFDEITH